MLINLSSKTLNIFSESYDSYADALYKYLEYKGIEKVWLAEKITPGGQKVASTQEKLSRWKREGSKPSKETRDLISEILGVSIVQNTNGKWVISRTEKRIYEQLETEQAQAVYEKITEYLASNSQQGGGDQTRKLLLAFREQLKSQVAQSSSMIQILNSILDE